MIFLKSLRSRYNTFTLRILTLLAVAAVIVYAETLERLDFVFYDVLSTIRQQPKDTNLVIVAIDEESIRELGSWPWSRGVHAELINRLKSIGDQPIAFDLLFSELHNGDPYGDELLSQAIATHGQVIFPVAPIVSQGHNAIELIRPHEVFAHNATLGHADIELDSDGVARRVYLHAGIDEPVWPTLGLALATKSLAVQSPLSRQVNQQPINRGNFWSRSDETLIPFSGKPGSFPQVGYSKILFDDAALASLKEKTIIVGMTAAGMGTRFATPASPSNRQPMTGVEWHANVYSMLQQGQSIHPVSKNWVMLVTMGWIGLILLALNLAKKDLTFPVLLLLLLFTLLLAYFPLHLLHVWIPPSASLLGTMAVYPLWNWRRINQFLRAYLINKIRSSSALETIGDGVIITDAHDHVVYLNRGAENILKTQCNLVTGKLLRQIVFVQYDPDSSSADALPIANQPGIDSPGILECKIRTNLGNQRNVRITRNQLYDEQQILIGSVVSMTDITDTVKLAQRITYQEEYDSLTKLPNRAKLLSRFDQMTQSIQDTNKTITVFFITLDNFKKINDAMGYQAGDKLLRMVSWRLFELVSQNEMIARWGGDEFIVLLNNLNDNHAAASVAQKILDIIGQHFVIDDMKVFVSASIGISFFPQDGLSSTLVLEKAGTAMHQAKHKGGNRFDFFTAQSSVVWTKDRLELEKDLRAAIENNELQVFFQPIVDASSHHVTRMEALVRWQHPERGFLSPGEFVPLAENIGLIDQLGERVLMISCLSTSRLVQAGYPVKVSVNVNPRQLVNPGFLDMIFKILQDTGLPSSALMLEITESAIVNNTERASEILQEIKAVGILIALDDFGTGYSSLTLLRELPIDILKIDKSFVRTLDQNQNDQKIVQAIIGLGKNLGLAVVAEGVETEKQSQMLLKHNCLFQQGYFFSPPVPYGALLDLISKKNDKMKRFVEH